MSTKTDTEVIIAGKVFTLSGYESEEYLQKVASYINNKIAEYNRIDSFRRQSLETQNVLLQLNIADDYFKAKKQINILEEDLKNKNDEVYALKHDLIAAQMKLENMEKNVRRLQAEANENAKQIIRMETELKEQKKRDLIAAQMKLDNAEKNVKRMPAETNEDAGQIVRMEKERKERKK